MSKGLLITGATGKQGGATINALLASPTSRTDDITILAVTRDPTSTSATALTTQSPAIKLIQGDLNDIPALFATAKATHPNIHGVFSVQIPASKGNSPETELTQGKALIDGALANNIKHFVYTSVERGGGATQHPATSVPHFASKHLIEQHLVSRTAGSNMTYTILRPTAFMENFTPGYMGKILGAACNVGLRGQAMSLISVADIGHFGAQALLHPERYRNRGISLAGDELTWSQMREVFRQRTGKPAPETFGFVGSALLWGVSEMGGMMRYLREERDGIDIQALRREHPGLLSMGDWIEKKSAFKTVAK